MYEEWRHNTLLSTTGVRVAPDSDLQKSAREDISSLIVREYIQNALDAFDHGKGESQSLKVPVVVNIQFVDVPRSVDRYFGELKEHIAMELYDTNKGIGEKPEDRQWKRLHTQIYDYLMREKGEKSATLNNVYNKEPNRGLKPIFDLFNLNQKCLILEDYNTTGLTGDISDDPDAEEEVTDNYSKFMYKDGVTNSEGSSGGSHGSGRKSLLYASCIHSILVYTRRDEDPEEVVSGISFTQARKNNAGRYLPESRFVDYKHGSRSDVILMQGHTDVEIIETVKGIFGLRKIRETAKKITPILGSRDSGSSMIIPFPDRRLSNWNIRLDILVNYTLSIYRGKLVVIQHLRNLGGKFRYDKDNIRKTLKTVLDQKEYEHRGYREKRRIVRCFYELLEEEKQNTFFQDEPDVTLSLDDKFKDRVWDAFKEKVKGNKLETIKRKYDRFEIIYIHITKKFAYDVRGKEEKEGHYRLYLKKVSGEGYSLLMRGFTVHLDEANNRQREGYVSLTIALSSEDGEENPYASFLRKCETSDHRQIDESRGMNEDVENYREYVRGFKKAYQICEYLEESSRRRDGRRVEDPLFVLPKQEIRQVRNRSGDGFSIESEGKQFRITATDFLKNRGIKDGETIEVYAYYGQESSGGSSTPLKQFFFPRFDIFLDRKYDDRIVKVENVEEGNARVVYTNSEYFQIRGVITDDLDMEYYVRCKLVEIEE